MQGDDAAEKCAFLAIVDLGNRSRTQKSQTYIQYRKFQVIAVILGADGVLHIPPVGHV